MVKAFLCTIIVYSSFVSQAMAKDIITFVVPYAAGGGIDLRSRQLADQVSEILQKKIVIENKPGAGGTIGTSFIARARPDGLTIGAANFAPLVINPNLMTNINYNPVKDLTPIILIEKAPLVLLVRNDSSFYTLSDIVEVARKNPGTLTFASSGVGGTHHLSGALLNHYANIHMTHIPYTSSVNAQIDLLNGTTSMMFQQLYSAAHYIQSGQLRPIAVTSRQRLKAMPTVPTVAELGYPKIIVYNWMGVTAPRGTSAAIIQQYNKAFNMALKNLQTQTSIQSQGYELVGGTPDEFEKFLNYESQRWKKILDFLSIDL